MRIVNFLLAVMFLLFAFVQLNDDNDVVIWILIYGSMAVYAVMAIFDFYPQYFLLATTAVYAMYSILYAEAFWHWLNSENKAALFDDIAKMENQYIEDTREFLGLMICIAVLIFYYIRSRSIRKNKLT